MIGGVLTACVLACGSPEPPPVPDERDLAVFAEVLLVEAILQDFTGPTKDSLAERYYGQLYDRFGTSAAGLDELRRRFSADPELWTALSDSVEARLDRVEADPSALINADLN